MAAPALQLIEPRFPGSGRFGADPFGYSPFGGSMWPPVPIARVQMGSDDLSRSDREFVSEIRLERYGHTIAARVFARARRWDVVYRATTAANVEALRTFFRVRNFLLLPDGNDHQNTIRVRWVGDDFTPELLSPGVYALKFGLEELI